MAQTTFFFCGPVLLNYTYVYCTCYTCILLVQLGRGRNTFTTFKKCIFLHKMLVQHEEMLVQYEEYKTKF